MEGWSGSQYVYLQERWFTVSLALSRLAHSRHRCRGRVVLISAVAQSHLPATLPPSFAKCGGVDALERPRDTGADWCPFACGVGYDESCMAEKDHLRPRQERHLELAAKRASGKADSHRVNGHALTASRSEKRRVGKECRS